MHSRMALNSLHGLGLALNLTMLLPQPPEDRDYSCALLLPPPASIQEMILSNDYFLICIEGNQYCTL
jgi:hypothetical protein